MNWSGLVWSDYHRLPLTDCFYSIEHSNLYPGSYYYYIYIYIPDSTNYKSTASGANKPTKHKYIKMSGGSLGSFFVHIIWIVKEIQQHESPKLDAF